MPAYLMYILHFGVMQLRIKHKLVKLSHSLHFPSKVHFPPLCLKWKCLKAPQSAELPKDGVSLQFLTATRTILT